MMNRKWKSLGIILVGGLFLTTACEKKLDTDLKKASYSIGQQIGTNLKAQNIEFDAEIVAMSLNDVKAGKPSRMTPDEIQKALMQLQEGISKKQAEVADQNLKKAEEFLNKNKTAEGVKVTASGLQYIMVQEGTGKAPSAKDTVKAHYKGTLITGETFDSSYDRGQPSEFPVGGVIKGWTEMLQMMKVGGKAKIFVPPGLAYGSSARPGIPANSVLVFEIELIDVKEGSATDMPKLGVPPPAESKKPSEKSGKKK